MFPLGAARGAVLVASRTGSGVDLSRQARSRRFGAFVFDPLTGELYRLGHRLRLPPQSAEVLSLLLQQPGDLVTRDALRARLWPAGTFVEFEHGLNAAINRLRQVLGDPAGASRYVETVPRHGYRFIGSVTGAEGPPPAATTPGDPPFDADVSPTRMLDGHPGADCVRGHAHLSTWTESGCWRAVRYFERALAHVPGFAPAWAGLAQAYLDMARFAYLPPETAGREARRAATRALALDPSLAEAHEVTAQVSWVIDWDVEAADEEFRRAEALSAGTVHGRLARARLLVLAGRFDEGLALGRDAAALDVVETTTQLWLPWALSHARCFEAAVEALERIVAVDPRSAWAQAHLAFALTHLDERDAAVSAASRALGLLAARANEQVLLSTAGWVLGTCRRLSDARAVLARFEALAERGWVDPVLTSLVLVGLGELAEAERQIERGIEAHSPAAWRLEVDPAFDRLRSSATFDGMTKRIPWLGPRSHRIRVSGAPNDSTSGAADRLSRA